ncbi:MAG: FHA domain-containing protein [Phycisphaerales bacterium]|nr:FHA domain-containing protein [Phycisphaerales bacterium]
MFGRLATVRIKTAEDAFAAGRLDDAFEFAVAKDLAHHRRIQKLRDNLAKALFKRGQDHLLAKRFAEAMTDFDRADQCGDMQKKIREWRRRAREAMEADQQAKADRAAALGQARERFDAGSLVGAANALAKAPADDSERAALSEAIDLQAQRAAQALSDAKDALKAGHVRLAVDHFRTARTLHNKLDGVAEMETELVEHVVRSATEGFKNGRLDRAVQDLASLGDVGRRHAGRNEIEDVVNLARDAALALSEDRYARANVLLGRLAQVSPKAGWVSEVRKHLSVLETHRRALLEGPLGMLSGENVPSTVQDRTRTVAEDTLVPPPVQSKQLQARDVRFPAPGLPRRLFLRIDGVGSFLLLRGDRLSIGRAGPGASADLQLISDLSERQAEIVRAGEDYFLVAQSGVELAGLPVDHALLQDGDRIRLSKRIRVKFHRPSLKSSAAALDLGDGVRTTTDCRRVILWSGPVLMGRRRECHIRLDHRFGDFVLMERGGRLYVKPMGPSGEATPVVLGDQVEVGELRFSVVDWASA